MVNVVAPGKERTGAQVVQVSLVGIGLALKRDVAVGVAAHGEPDGPFHQVGQVKAHEQQLALLCRMDALVVHHLVAQVHARVHKQHSQQVDGREAVKGQYGRADDFHVGKGTNFLLSCSFFLCPS